MKEQRSQPRGSRRVLVAALVCVLAVALSFTALAAGVPGFRAWLFGPESGVAEKVTSLADIAEDLGIEMELVGMANDGDVLAAYFTLRDITGQDRLDEHTILRLYSRAAEASTQLYPVGDGVASRMYSVSTYCAIPVNYDRDTGTLLARFEVPNMDSVTAEEMDFTIYEIQSREHAYIGCLSLNGMLSETPETETIKAAASYTSPVAISYEPETDTGADICEIRAGQEFAGTMPLERIEGPVGDTVMFGSSVFPDEACWRDDSGFPAALVCGEGTPMEGGSGFTLKGASVVNGKLRVQAGLSPELAGKHALGLTRFWLVPEDLEVDWDRFVTDGDYASDVSAAAYQCGEGLLADSTLNFYHGEQGLTTGAEFEGTIPSMALPLNNCEFVEAVFEVPEDGPEHYRAAVLASTCDTYLQGNWSVKFPIPQAEHSARTEEIALADGSAVTAEIRAGSITFRGGYDALEELALEAPFGFTADFNGRTVSYRFTVMPEHTLANGLTLYRGSDKAVCIPDVLIDPDGLTAIEIGGVRMELN